MAAPFRQRFPLSVSSVRAILRCRGTVAAIIGRCLTAEPDINAAGSAAPAAARTSGGQDTYGGPWNTRTSPILEVGDPTGPFIPLRNAVAMPRRLADVRLLTVHGYGHAAFLPPDTCARTYMTTYFHAGALPAGRPRARGLKSMGCTAQ
jgi:hypothetical protein